MGIYWTSPIFTVSAMCSRYLSRNVVWYLRINNLIRPLKNLADDNKIVLLAAADVFYLSEEEQETVYKVIDATGVKLNPQMAEILGQIRIKKMPDQSREAKGNSLPLMVYQYRKMMSAMLKVQDEGGKIRTVRKTQVHSQEEKMYAGVSSVEFSGTLMILDQQVDVWLIHYKEENRWA